MISIFNYFLVGLEEDGKKGIRFKICEFTVGVKLTLLTLNLNYNKGRRSGTCARGSAGHSIQKCRRIRFFRHPFGGVSAASRWTAWRCLWVQGVDEEPCWSDGWPQRCRPKATGYHDNYTELSHIDLPMSFKQLDSLNSLTVRIALFRSFVL